MTTRTRILSSAACAVIAVALLLPAASAQGLSGGRIDATLNEAGDYRVAGANVTLSGSVAGALTVMSANFNTTGLDVGGLTMNAADAAFSGAVREDARINAADLVFSGDVGGQLRANIADGDVSGHFGSVAINAANLTLDEGVIISDDARVNAARFEMKGVSDGLLDVSARTIILSGDADGGIAFYADPGRNPRRDSDGLVEISGSAGGGAICARRVVISGVVSGPLDVTADEEPVIESGASVDDIVFTPRNGQRCERG